MEDAAGAATLASDVAQLDGNALVADSSLVDKDDASGVVWPTSSEADGDNLIAADQQVGDAAKRWGDESRAQYRP